MNAKWKLPEISHYFWSYYHFNASDLFAGTGTGVLFPELSPFLREADGMYLSPSASIKCNETDEHSLMDKTECARSCSNYISVTAHPFGNDKRCDVDSYSTEEIYTKDTSVGNAYIKTSTSPQATSLRTFPSSTPIPSGPSKVYAVWCCMVDAIGSSTCT